MEVLFGILIPFLGTTLGSACVFFMKKSLGDLVQRALAGFAAGVMVAASIWSLLIPAIEQSEDMGKLSFLPAFIGFWVGVLFLLLLDRLIPHLHVGSDKAEGPKSKLGRTTMMVLAVTLHNIPEGMAVGVMYAGFLAGNAQITAASALALSLGIAIQNFPEGAIISMPLRAEGESKGKAFLGRRAFRRGRACRRGADASCGAACDSGAAVSSELCGRRDALCCGRGADSGNVAGAALQHRNDFLCGRLQHHDDAGCGFGIRRQMMIVQVILEGLGLGVLLILVCAIGIRKGAVGMVHLYSPEVQDRCVKLGLTTHEKIKRNALIFKAVCVPGYIAYVLVCVYAVNGARGFLAGFWQLLVILSVMNLIDRFWVDGYWVGHTNAWDDPRNRGPEALHYR